MGLFRKSKGSSAKVSSKKTAKGKSSVTKAVKKKGKTKGVAVASKKAKSGAKKKVGEKKKEKKKKKERKEIKLSKKQKKELESAVDTFVFEDFKIMFQATLLFQTDADGDGDISTAELGEFIKATGGDTKNAKKLMKKYDKDHNGKLNLEEFMDLMIDKDQELFADGSLTAQKAQKFRDAFDSFDLDHNGSIDLDELRVAAHLILDKKTAKALGEAEVKSILDQLEMNNDLNHLGFTEFLSVMSGLALGLASAEELGAIHLVHRRDQLRETTSDVSASETSGTRSASASMSISQSTGGSTSASGGSSS